MYKQNIYLLERKNLTPMQIFAVYSQMALHPSDFIQHFYYILSRASEVGSPANPPWAPGSDKTRGQGSFGPFTVGKETNRTFDPLLLRQGEPGTPQNIVIYSKIENKILSLIHWENP